MHKSYRNLITLHALVEFTVVLFVTSTKGFTPKQGPAELRLAAECMCLLSMKALHGEEDGLMVWPIGSRLVSSISPSPCSPLSSFAPSLNRRLAAVGSALSGM
jgi:hypothetical protein